MAEDVITDIEKQVMGNVREAIGKSIVEQLSSYHSPLKALTEAVVAKHNPDLFELIDGEFSKLIGGKAFRDDLRRALNKKLARLLIEKMGGELEKRVRELKENPETRAKITLAIGEIIDAM